ncbi:tRNA-specific adenosine deaminase [Neofusicoccum parvum]|uniref:tRNA-specific adenosine deaminase n=1 Tax=Neofusicoccum parvum TaxID=310453 RepID=A0ACB5RUA4_9PEZI|nr:tRNA-specific adenosine deaminase [Neofusicoccum parvum]
MPPAPADVQACVLRAFDALPAKCKPRARDARAREWVPLAGIVLSTGTRALSGRDVAGDSADEGRSTLTCAALGTGMKCLPATKVASARGVVLHDWHAEVLAFRAFNRFLVDECAALVSSSGHVSDFVRRRDASEISRAAPQPFALRSDVEMHMYCSEAPCGDASMELTMGAQEDPTPWSLPANPTPATAGNKDEAEAEAEVVLRGRGYFSELGVVRRKPGTPSRMSWPISY